MTNYYPFMRLLIVIAFITLNGFCAAFGQAPSITYPTPNTYNTGQTITPLSPANSGSEVVPETYGITTYAGSTGTAGTFNFINGMAIAGNGSLYVTDASQRVLKITPDGLLTVVAGIAGKSGNTNGQGSAALFNNPGQVITDAAGNIFVADQVNDMIRKITPSGLVSTYAGTGVAGKADGPAATATFFQPAGIIFDGAGNLYVADFNNSAIRKITPGGTVSTFAGLAGTAGFIDGNGASARFSGPRYLAIDAAGNIYVSDEYNNAVRKITPAGDVTTLAGTGTAGSQNGIGKIASFNQPAGIAVDAEGDVYVADEGNYCIRRITPAGVVSTYAGTGQQGSTNGYPLTAIKFFDPRDIIIDGSGNFYVADATAIRKINVSGYEIDKPLPPGLYFDTGTGIITGTPAAASPPTDYTITAYNTGGASSFTIQITVNEVLQAPNIGYVSPQVYSEFKTITPLSPINSGGAVTSTYTIDKLLPSGLTFDPTTGVISGTPVVLSPPTDYTIVASNAAGSSTFVINISINIHQTAPQTLTFNPLSAKTYGDADFDPAATSTNSTIPVTYASSNTGVATIVAGMIHITGTGTSQITASQAGNDYYLAATPVMQELTVNKAPLLLVADNKVKFENQPNPALTFTGVGFVYNEDASVLTEQPVLSTAATADSAPGDYVIAITGGQAANYTVTTTPGTLTVSVTDLSIIIPNAFTPNGDGINDYWDIKAIEGFPQCLVSVFARNGSLVFQSRGYPHPWDGTYKGLALPNGTYYYVISPSAGLKSLSGSVTILR